MANGQDDDDNDAMGSETEGGERAGEERPRRMSDTVKKAIAQGFRSVRSSEEKLRGMVSDAMPKEVVTYLKGAIDSGRDELVRIVGNQTRKFLEGIDVGGEISKILTALSFEIRTEIRFIPNDQKVKPDIKMTVKPKKVERGERDKE